MKKIHEISRGKVSVKVMYDNEWQEYRCQLFVKGFHQGINSDYHTGDKEDAISTALVMLNDAIKDSLNHTLKVGSIVYNSWGYDQTNVDFYQVVKATKCFVTLRPIEAIKGEDGPQAMTGKAMPVKDRFSSEVTTRHKAEFWNGENIVKFQFGAGCEWDGQPKRYSTYA